MDERDIDLIVRLLDNHRSTLGETIAAMRAAGGGYAIEGFIEPINTEAYHCSQLIASLRSVPLVKEVDPGLERILAEEEEIEREARAYQQYTNAGGRMNRYRWQAAYRPSEKLPYEDEYYAYCDDRDDRHGAIYTYHNWAAAGRPQ